MKDLLVQRYTINLNLPNILREIFSDCLKVDLVKR